MTRETPQNAPKLWPAGPTYLFLEFGFMYYMFCTMQKLFVPVNLAESGLGRVTENMAQYQGVIVMTMNDVPLGFGAAAKSTGEIRKKGD